MSMHFNKPGRPRHITQGEFAIGDGSGGSLTTILGSCVATCLFDEQAGVGGMNHFLLPEGSTQGVQVASFGVNAMELLINALTKQGARRDRLKAKIFGGARMIEGLSDVGAKNAVFVRDFLRREGIVCVGESLGGTSARRVEFWPETGRARQRLLDDARLREEPPKTAGNEVELF
ncbi:chemotaxis protein CheD [Phaeovulum vinaykumarii]|uniref:Probable chemoreceptor glutamine deamidase CheD n=1 Tax=Phaeovulum vinaykumarii TaxID=407234 RepID=A0A1N7MTX2_9RHOB|nr:chemotaxis protein CheD [Phaeovulum vinaykumarii]SIS89546.1 chemotaxis protein CheD [Phaeovulum vinaykumarii]SOC18396.1 chemotaxis protein CheD [Phaeovulum vinaykumarii]